MIPVTKPFLPLKEEYESYLSGIWRRNWLTNNGPLVNELELQLKKYLGVKHMLLTSNGTISLQIAIKALGLHGKVITTPFSYIATSSSLVWENCKPVFVDIDINTLNIDANQIENYISDDVSGIVATHCFGNACNIEEIERIAAKHNLKVIYDAAHAFGTRYKNQSIFTYGDVSSTSFHSTKLFHTIEGGGLFTNSPELLKRMAYMRNFGHDGPEKFNGVGVNGKNSEFHAAMGLCVLSHMNEILEERKSQCLYYDEILTKLKVTKPKVQPDCTPNFSYYPVIFESEDSALKAKLTLESKEIFPRRYFYPSLSKLDYVKAYSTPISDDISSRILCLPLFSGLSKEEQDMIARLLLRSQNY